MNIRTGILGMVAAAALTAMAADITSPWERENKQPDPSQGAVVSQVIGANTWVQITYHRPGVKDRDIWTAKSNNPQIGRLVPHDGEPRPWRVGANEATTIEFSEDVRIEGQPLAAGKYALFMVPSEDGDWKMLFNEDAGQWGSFNYDKEKDALKVRATPVEVEHTEWLTFGFDDPKAYQTTAFMQWEKVKIPFKIQTDDG
jgi:hypothetical protein